MSATEKNNEKEKTYDIIIVGGGSTGLCAALTLATSGIKIALIARSQKNTRDERTTALLSSSATMLNKLGLWDQISSHTAALKTMRLIDATNRLFRAPTVEFSSTEIGLKAFGYNVPNQHLNATLQKAIKRKKEIDYILSEVESIKPAADIVHVTLANGIYCKAPLIIGADGRNSICRQAAHIKTHSWYYDQTALVLNFSHELPHNDTSNEFHTPTGPFTMVPLGDKRSSLVCVETQTGAQDLHKMDDKQLNLELEKRAHSLLGKMSVETKRQIWPLSSFVARPFASSRIALIGEAAHGFPPIGAQGFNLSLRDVATISELVIDAYQHKRDFGGQDLLNQYNTKRRNDVWTRTIGIDFLNRSLMSAFLPMHGLRALGLTIAHQFAPMRKLLMREGIAPHIGLPKMMRDTSTNKL